MSVRKAGGGIPRNLDAQQGRDARKADDSADNKQELRETGRGRYLSPRKVNTEKERRAALARKHEAELDDEAVKHMHTDSDDVQVKREEEIEDEVKLQGVNLDEERKKRGQRDGESEDKEREEEAAKRLGQDVGAGRYFEDLPEDRVGDLTLTDPNEMKRQLGPSVRFAQHAMLLAQKKMDEGMPRSEALEHLASIYLGVSQRSYARKALREFGPATGILNIYPVELMQHLFENVPSFLPKVSVGSFFTAPKKRAQELVAGEPWTLEYDPKLKIRGFAIKGGANPGYVFEPVDPEGTYELTISTPGDLTVLITAIARGGRVVIEELHVSVAPGDTETIDEDDARRRARAGLEDDDKLEDKPDKPDKKDDLKFVIPRYI